MKLKATDVEKEKKIVEVWYYDACALDCDKDVYRYIVNKSNRSLVSYLAIGEAYGKSIKKG